MKQGLAISIMRWFEKRGVLFRPRRQKLQRWDHECRLIGETGNSFLSARSALLEAADLNISPRVGCIIWPRRQAFTFALDYC